MKKTVLSLTLFSATLFLAGARAASPESAPAMTAGQTALMRRYDTNHDGKLDEAELAAAHESMLKENGAGERGGRVRAALLRKFDLNGDGKLDPEERAAMKRVALQRFDKNGDGRLDDQERAAMRDELKAQYQAGKPKN